MKMKFVTLCILVTTVYGRNFRNVEFNELPEEKLLDAVCRSFHKTTGPLPYRCSTDACDWTNKNFSLTEFKIVKKQSRLNVPKLLCKEDDMIHFFWEGKNDSAYFLEGRSINENYEMFSNVTTCSYYTLTNLTQGTVYKIRLWAVSFLKKQIVHSDVITIATLNKSSVPRPVTNISLQKFILSENSYDAVITWTPNEDYSCQYDLVWLKEESIHEERINVISGTHQAVLKELNFQANYTVEIVARSKDLLHESPKKSLHFVTPSCLETYHTLDKCRPEVPRNLVINETVVDLSEEILTYNIHLKWSKPDLLPTYYIAHFIDLMNQNNSEHFLNITGDKTNGMFEGVLLGELYHISLMACSPAGCSQKVAEERHRANVNVTTITSHLQWKVLVLVLTPLVAALIGTVIINYYRAKQKRRGERERYFTGLDEEKQPESVEILEINLIKQDSPDQWEIEPDKLYFQSVIGEGAFGVVRKACLETKNNTKIQVAVKMLKESPTSEENRQFIQEINIMKSVRQHPNIVSLVGCVTEGRPEGPLLVVEYCARGDLQTYLRNAWDKFCNIQQQIINSDEICNREKNYFANKTYDFQNMNFEDQFIIQPKHLLSVARQVALGMEHLAQTRVVHRDLAARNVLVCENHTVKVSDFGLSRDVYRDNVYCKSGGGKLPVGWMALESLTHQRYTTHSDVWSFGILLWEIVTLGGTPYVGIHSSDLLEFLKNGNRLVCPSNCSPELYAIMQSCWKSSPKNRPTFTEICKHLEDLLGNVTHYLQLENTSQSFKSDTKNVTPNKLDQSGYSNERYVKPCTFR